MNRHIYCMVCAPKRRGMHPEDVAMGWVSRTLSGKSKCPAGHGYTVITGGKSEFTPLAFLACDQCGENIPNGTYIELRTMWRRDGEDEPGDWESEFVEPKEPTTAPANYLHGDSSDESKAGAASLK